MVSSPTECDRMFQKHHLLPPNQEFEHRVPVTGLMHSETEHGCSVAPEAVGLGKNTKGGVAAGGTGQWNPHGEG